MRTNRAGVRTDAEKRARVIEVMRLHRAGYACLVISQRTGTEPGTAARWARELGMEWTGKPMRRRNAKAGEPHSESEEYCTAGSPRPGGRGYGEKSDAAQGVPTLGGAA